MNYALPNTLAYFNQAPHLKLIDVGHIPVPVVAINCKAYLLDSGKPTPEKLAIEFYALNHLVMMVRNKFTEHEVLPEWALDVMGKYDECLGSQGRRMLTYLALITARESRHIKNLSTVETHLSSAYGVGLVKQMKSTLNFNPTETANYFLKSPPDINLSKYYNGLVEVFATGKFNGGYGGMPWSNIAKTLAAFIDGNISMEMMLDNAYTLAHNGGPIFNKGMCYGDYSNEIYKVLDVQRSGQMPEYVVQNNKKWADPSDVGPIVKKVVDLFPEEFGTEVDWYKVEALGAVHTYPTEKAAMKKQQQKTPAKPKEPEVINGNKVIGKLEVMKGHTVSIIERAI